LEAVNTVKRFSNFGFPYVIGPAFPLLHFPLPHFQRPHWKAWYIVNRKSK